MRSHLLPFVLLLPLPACGALPVPAPSPAATAARPAAAPPTAALSTDGSPADAVDAAAEGTAERAVDPAVDATAPRTQSAGAFLTSDELDLVRGEDFRRRFLESYIADTDTEPTLDPAERTVIGQVMTQVGEQHVAEALALLEQHRGPAASAAIDFMVGQLRFGRDEVDAAIAAWELAVQKHPKFKRAWTNLAQVQYREGRLQPALQALTKVVQLGGGDSLVFGMLGVVHQKRGNDVAAESAFRMACMLDPDKADWQMGLADSLFRQGRFADGAALFQSLIRQYPDKADLWRYQGEAFAQLGQPLRAIENFEMVERLGGAKPVVLNNLGDLYANQKLFDLAVGAYLRALELENTGGTARVLRAAHFLSGNAAMDETAALLDGLERLRGDQLQEAERKDLLNLRVRVAMSQGGSAAEAEALQQLIALDPLDGGALVQLAGWFERNGRTDEAVLRFEQAAGIDGFEGKAKQAWGQLLVRQGRYAEALPLLQRALELAPRDSLQRYVEQVERAAQAR